MKCQSPSNPRYFAGSGRWCKYDSLLVQTVQPHSIPMKCPPFLLISIPSGCASQGYKGTAIVEICTEPGGPYLLSGCGAKRCIAPEAKAMKYYKLEVPGNLGDCLGVNQHRRAKAMVSLGECFANGVLCQTSMLVYKRICSIWKIQLEISMFEITYCKTYSKHILFTNVSQITWKWAFKHWDLFCWSSNNIFLLGVVFSQNMFRM